MVTIDDFATFTKEMNKYKSTSGRSVGVMHFLTGRLPDLVEMARAHRDDHAKAHYYDATLAVVHPFYAGIADAQQWEPFQQDLKAYEERLVQVLKENSRNKRYHVVVLETPLHYANRTAGLLEEGLVDDVVFTTAHGARLLEGEAFERTDAPIFFAGGYSVYTSESGPKAHYMCLGRAVVSRRLAARQPQSIQLVADLSLPYHEDVGLSRGFLHAQEKANLIMGRIVNGYVHSSELITSAQQAS